ncbi:oxidoreductase [Iris pallida]|uniref:Oxidoreductase n=1 Tax=Iris pallida TaxID=29817 RepID=A0AAX6E0X4_IRIPA|nr:oxidoreductase [Iris pallida]
MDGSMWLHHPRTERMKEILAAHDFGPLKMIHCSSTFSATPNFLQNNIRVKHDLDSLGALGDLGWYCVGAILWAVDYQLPDTVTALPSLHLNQSGVILACAAAFHWTDHDMIATFHCSFLSNVSMDLSVHGTNASLQVKDLAIPYQESSATFDFTCGANFADLHIGWSRKPEEVVVQTDLPQEALMIEEFSRIVGNVKNSNCRPDSKWPEVTRKTQMMVDAVKSSIELGFTPVDL